MMNAQAILAAGRINDLQAEAADRRLENEAKKAGQTMQTRVARFVAAIRATLTETEISPVLPKLSDYPFRS